MGLKNKYYILKQACIHFRDRPLKFTDPLQ